MADSLLMLLLRWIGVIVVTSLPLTACSGDEDSPEVRAGKAAARFVQAWESGEPTGVADADELISQQHDRLQVTGTAIEVPERATCNDDETRCEAAAEVTLTLQGIGDWAYDTTIALRREAQGGDWVVDWTPSTFHPRLTGDTSLDRHRELPPRAAITGAGGKALTTDQQVMRIGVVPEKVEPLTFARLADLLDIDPAGLRERVGAAQPQWFVPVITLRREQYQPVRSDLLQVPGVSVDEDTWSLTKSSSWGRALIGTVAPATQDTLKKAGPLAAPTDVVGSSGLQLAYQQQLAGTPGGGVDLVDAESGARLESLFTKQPKPGEPLQTTIDVAMQDAAEAAVTEQDKTTALVAVRASTGEILASAVGPGITSYNSAFVGQYPPGSTFKVVSAAALLDSGTVRPEEPVPCPPTTTVNGKSFKNYDDFESLAAHPTFAQDIAASCNTAVVGQASKLSAEALPAAAEALGLGAEWDLGMPAFSGKVPAADDVVDRAAAMIGQGRVLASPLSMAMVAATVSSGEARAPRLLADKEQGEPKPLEPALARDLTSMMRLTVTDGTASELDLPGQPVHAKTGTAEIDSDDPSKTHAWIIGFRADVAFAVLVENGASGSEDAAPVVRSFLEQAPGA